MKICWNLTVAHGDRAGNSTESGNCLNLDQDRKAPSNEPFLANARRFCSSRQQATQQKTSVDNGAQSVCPVYGMQLVSREGWWLQSYKDWKSGFDLRDLANAPVLGAGSPLTCNSRM